MGNAGLQLLVVLVENGRVLLHHPADLLVGVPGRASKVLLLERGQRLVGML